MRSPPVSRKHCTQNARVAGAIAKLSAKARSTPICATAAKAWFPQNEAVIPSEAEGCRIPNRCYSSLVLFGKCYQYRRGFWLFQKQQRIFYRAVVRCPDRGGFPSLAQTT